MRRVQVLALVLVALTTTIAAGCSGVDAQKTQTILDGSTGAMAKVKSISFAMRMWTSGGPEGTDFTVLMHGGGYEKGKRAGEAYVTMSSEDLPGVGSMTVVTKRGAVFVRAGGSWTRVQVPAGTSSADPLAGFDLTRYVTDVRVEEGVSLGGEPMDRITGVVDTSAALDGLLGTLGGTGMAGLGDASDALGDIRVVLYVSETTHLPMRTLVDMPIEVADQKIVMHLDLVLTSVDKRVAIPSVG
ncbi:MAG TPA: hypothetical protein VFW80_05470 [Gaiellaceae bacterium]|nr:hypothetical protein [Gaiellaceae bacterium]